MRRQNPRFNPDNLLPPSSPQPHPPQALPSTNPVACAPSALNPSLTWTQPISHAGGVWGCHSDRRGGSDNTAPQRPNPARAEGPSQAARVGQATSTGAHSDTEGGPRSGQGVLGAAPVQAHHGHSTEAGHRCFRASGLLRGTSPPAPPGCKARQAHGPEEAPQNQSSWLAQGGLEEGGVVMSVRGVDPETETDAHLREVGSQGLWEPHIPLLARPHPPWPWGPRGTQRGFELVPMGHFSLSLTTPFLIHPMLLTHIRLFVVLDVVSQFEVSRDDGHLWGIVSVRGKPGPLKPVARCQPEGPPPPASTSGRCH